MSDVGSLWSKIQEPLEAAEVRGRTIHENAERVNQTSRERASFIASLVEQTESLEVEVKVSMIA